MDMIWGCDFMAMGMMLMVYDDGGCRSFFSSVMEKDPKSWRVLTIGIGT